MSTTFNVISLGVNTAVDPFEGDADAERASALVGMTFGDASDPLRDHIASFSPGTTGYGSYGSTTYDQNNRVANDTFSIDGGADQLFDGGAVYYATITYIDGTTASVTAAIVQDVNGNTYWLPEMSFGADQVAMEAKPIQSLTIDSVFAGTNLTFVADRDPWDGAVICFASGTSIETCGGKVQVEYLEVGAEVRTLDSGCQPLRWIRSRTFGADDLATNPKLRPIRIRAGGLGPNQPETDLLVSPQHRVLVRSKVAERMFGKTEVLVAAKHLLAFEGIEVANDLTEVTYWHFLLDTHQVVFSNGAMTESLFTGPEALKTVSPEAREEILEIFPDLAANSATDAAPIRPLVRGRSARKLAERMTRNRKPLVA